MIDERGIDPSLVPLLSACSERLAAQLGLHYPPDKWSELSRGIAAAAPALGCADLRSCLEEVRARPLDLARQEILAQHLTIGETYFFRDPAVFAALREQILPPLIGARSGRGDEGRWLRVWSAGCSSGEEAYSLAIMLLEMLPDPSRWHLTILATDINVQALAKAQQGVYSDWSFRNTAPDFKTRYFTPTEGGRYLIDPRVREMVSFVPLNLVQDVYPAVQTNTTGMDLVFCRNVLMYLSAEQTAAAVSRLARCLAEGGWFVVSPVEASLVSAPDLQSQAFPNAILFRKRSVRAVDERSRARIAPSRDHAMASPASHAATRRLPGRAGAFAEAEAEAHYAQGRYPQAVAVLERLLADGGGHSDDAMLLLARALANVGRLGEALAWCDRALAARPLDPARSYLRGSILLEEGLLDAAVAAFQRALYLDPDFPLAHFALGSVFARRKQPALARRHYRRAQEILEHMPEDLTLPEADGIPAVRMLEMIAAIGDMEAAG